MAPTKLPGPLTLNNALEGLTVDELKKRVALLPTADRPARKANLVALLEQHLRGASLRELWGRLDETQQHAVREAIYAPDGAFKAEKFRAKYGSLPSFGSKDERWSYHETPSLLRLFFYSPQRYSSAESIVPVELQQQLRSFVPAPPGATLSDVEELPECIERTEKHYSYDADDDGPLLISRSKVYKLPRNPKVSVETQQIPLMRRDTEHTAPHDLLTVLQLIDKGRVAVSDKTFQASAASTTELAALLRDGDFYPLQPQQAKWQQTIGPIKAFAWPLLVQAGKLAELHGKKLALTRGGRQALSAPPADTLRLLWQRWQSNKLLDEFQRIDTVKGQQGKGKHGMTAVANRRSVIAEALRQCPVECWVEFADFSRFMQAKDLHFEVTRHPWALYIAAQNYGNLGDNAHGWPILQERYMLALLCEYAATLGMLDVAYIPPAKARRDFRDMWGTDDLDFLSRYDGFLYFRLNPLGAYCLGVAPTYQPSRPVLRTTLTVLPSLRLTVTGEPLSVDEALFLETYADQETATTWSLNRIKALAAVERGHRIAELRSFLQARDNQPLPETVEGFFMTTEQRAQSLVAKGQAILIECVSPDIADLVANHAATRALCLRAGERHLVVTTAAEEAFRRALHGLGYGMPVG